MAYWRMQVHPNDAKSAMRHTVQSLAAGFIGLDFEEDVPDMKTISQEQLPERERQYWAFAHEMDEGDHVLVFAHHYPVALVRIAGEYNYIRSEQSHIGIWFRHFRRVKDVKYFADFRTDARSWERITMTATITPLRDRDSASFRLIETWLAETDGTSST